MPLPNLLEPVLSPSSLAVTSFTSVNIASAPEGNDDLEKMSEKRDLFHYEDSDSETLAPSSPPIATKDQSFVVEVITYADASSSTVVSQIDSRISQFDKMSEKRDIFLYPDSDSETLAPPSPPNADLDESHRDDIENSKPVSTSRLTIISQLGKRSIELENIGEKRDILLYQDSDSETLAPPSPANAGIDASFTRDALDTTATKEKLIEETSLSPSLLEDHGNYEDSDVPPVKLKKLDTNGTGFCDTPPVAFMCARSEKSGMAFEKFWLTRFTRRRVPIFKGRFCQDRGSWLPSAYRCGICKWGFYIDMIEFHENQCTGGRSPPPPLPGHDSSSDQE